MPKIKGPTFIPGIFGYECRPTFVTNLDKLIDKKLDCRPELWQILGAARQGYFYQKYDKKSTIQHEGKINSTAQFSKKKPLPS